MHITVLMFAAHTWGSAYFGFDKWPNWAADAVEKAAYTGPPTVCSVINASDFTTPPFFLNSTGVNASDLATAIL